MTKSGGFRDRLVRFVIACHLVVGQNLLGSKTRPNRQAQTSSYFNTNTLPT